MRTAWRAEAPSLAAAAVFTLLAGGMAAAFGVGIPPQHAASAPFPAQPIALPGPGEDRDHDTYGDIEDLWNGDAIAVVDLTTLETGRTRSRPYVEIGTQDDHWRIGAGRELEWRHVVDPDALGHAAGSPAWTDQALRTGHWVRTVPHPDMDVAIAEASSLGPSMVPPQAEWPQRLIVNVRDDRASVALELRVWDTHTSPHRLLGQWDILVRPGQGAWAAAATTAGGTGGEAPLDETLELTAPEGVRVGVAVGWDVDVDLEVKRTIAERSAPILIFDSGERFYPSRGEGMERFHGFFRRDADLRTWLRSFNNGVDGYRLLTGDFDGDGDTDAKDVAVATDILRGGGVMAPAVYAHVARAAGDRVVVQYWFLYPYNFVLDESGREVPVLAHEGDRESMHLVFADEQAALAGRPDWLAYKQHYGGIRMEDPGPGVAPFHLDDEKPAVYVARGSHASFPVPGDDAGTRPALVGVHDRFDGLGERWTRDDYALEVLADQTWYAGYLYGPITRFDRSLGTSLKPLLAHSFTYPFLDPIPWLAHLKEVEADDLAGIYDTPEEGT